MEKDKTSILYFTLILIILIIIGFIGYYYGFLKFIYNVMIPNIFSNYHIILLSIIFGLAAFFSPCAFTVLPAYTSFYLGEKEKRKIIAKSLHLGFMAALGIITVNMIIGLIIALLGSATPFAKDPRQDMPIILAIRTLAGLFIAIFGFSIIIKKSISLHFIQKYFSKLNLPQNIYTYGIIYNSAAIGCTGPILLSLMLYSYSSGSFTKTITAFIIFSLTMGILMILITLLIGLFKKAIIKNLIDIMPIVKTLAAAIMIVVGLSIVILTLEGNNLFVKLFFPYLK